MKVIHNLIVTLLTSASAHRIPHMSDRHIVHFQDTYVHMKYANILSLSLLTIHICHFVPHELAMYV